MDGEKVMGTQCPPQPSIRPHNQVRTVSSEEQWRICTYGVETKVRRITLIRFEFGARCWDP